MPSVSQAQQRLMRAILNGTKIAGGPSKEVARKFAAADHARGPKKLPQHVKKKKSG
jgi:hypothetical protein